MSPSNAEAWAVAERAGASVGFSVQALVDKAQGAQSEVFIFSIIPAELLPEDRVCIKISNEPASSLFREFDLLSRFHAALNHARCRVVSPLGLYLDESGAYAATFVSGVTLHSYWRTVEHDPDWLGSDLLLALKIFHSETGRCFGDFHPGNVLATDLSVAMLDPGSPTPEYDVIAASTEFGVISADLGYWTFATALECLRRTFHPSYIRRSIGFTTAFLELAACSGEGAPYTFLEDVKMAASKHVEILRSKGHPRDRLIAFCTKVVVLVIIKACKRGALRPAGERA